MEKMAQETRTPLNTGDNKTTINKYNRLIQKESFAEGDSDHGTSIFADKSLSPFSELD